MAVWGGWRCSRVELRCGAHDGGAGPSLHALCDAQPDQSPAPVATQSPVAWPFSGAPLPPVAAPISGSPPSPVAPPISGAPHSTVVPPNATGDAGFCVGATVAPGCENEGPRAVDLRSRDAFEPFVEMQPRCRKCMCSIDDVCKPGVKVIGKTTPGFQCPKCGSKVVMLTKLFGHWPVEAFQGLSADDQKRFWEQTDSTSDSLKKAAVGVIAKSRVELHMGS